MKTLRIPGFVKVWHLCYYYKADRDKFSNNIISFKNGIEATIRKWIRWAKEEIVPALDNADVKIDYVVRVLGSKETNYVAGKPLGKLSYSLSEEIDAEYVTDSLSKTRETNKFTGLNLMQRQQEINDVYQVNDNHNFNHKNILIIDDVTTSGTTLIAVRNAILEKYPKAILYGFCLGKTSDDHTANNDIECNYF